MQVMIKFIALPTIRETSKSRRKFPSAEGWHEVTGWFGMIPIQIMLPEVCNFGT